VVDDQMVFYQRVGQRLITSTFGLGSNVGMKPENQYGTAWRFHDPIELKRLQYLADESKGACTFDGMDQPSITLASVGKRRTELIKMMLECEEWLRTGFYREQRITPKNDSYPLNDRVARIKVVVASMMFPGLVGKIATDLGKTMSGGLTIEDALAKALLTQINIGGIVLAINEAKEFLMHGPVNHFRYMCGAYIAAPTQSSACCDCETPIHVLQGTMLTNRYSECTGCHARRCLHCADVYSKAVQVTTPQVVGKRCHACGADPAYVDVIKTTGQDGHDTFSVSLGPRVPWRSGANLEPVETGSSGPSSAPMPTLAKSKKVGRK
jgi:hypothetical protein